MAENPICESNSLCAVLNLFCEIQGERQAHSQELEDRCVDCGQTSLVRFGKIGRQNAESQSDVARGKLTFGEVLIIYRQRISGDVSLKPRTKEYHEERSEALLKSWTGLQKTDIARIKNQTV
jgi:hypothetical protein